MLPDIITPNRFIINSGVQIPCTYKEALQFNHDNGNSLWQTATALELQQLQEYDCFCDLSLSAIPPAIFTKSPCALYVLLRRMDITKGIWLPMVTSHLSWRNLSTEVLHPSIACILSPSSWSSISRSSCKGILATPIWNPTQMKKSTLLLDLSLGPCWAYPGYCQSPLWPQI